MPIRWDISHPEKFVHIVAEGQVTMKEMEDHFDALMVADALRYAKLFDISKGDPIYRDEDVMMMGARLSAYTSTMASGPLAVVGAGEFLEMTFRRFVNISPSKRPAKLFTTEAKARAWLATQSTP